MKKVIVVDPGPIGQALKQVLELKGGMEVLVVKDEDSLIDALGTFPAEVMVIGTLNDTTLGQFARDNARPGQRVIRLGWKKESSPSPDPNYIRLPILGDGIVKILLKI